MKKKILLISSMLVTFILIIFVSLNNTNNENKNVLSNTNKDTEVINSNMITMMYETEAGTGVYEETRDTSWPESGYIFNNNLSGCENGGELEYNSINNTVNLLSNKSDNCYVYFDKYDGVWIDNVSVTNVTGSSVTLDISATSENGSITTYYYSLNDNEEYQETTSNPITINDLNKLTEYKISIYVIDNTNARSNIYELTVTTIDESRPVINSVSVNNITTSGFTLTVDATSDIGIKRYHYIIESENIAGTSASNSYTFNSLTDSTLYNVSVFVIDNNDNKSNNYNISVETDTLLLLADWVIGEYNGIQGNNGIYYHTSSLANSAGDNSYRYAGANPNNYVCFGSDETTCPSDNLYRIIGVFDDEIKLIKSTSYGSYVWDSGNSNTWNATTKPDIYTTLNTTYLNSLGNTWSSMIATHSYEVGGVVRDTSATAKEYYDVEVGSSQSGYTELMKIGLIYVSDYGFAAPTSDWTTALYDYGWTTDIDDNWMFPGPYDYLEWTISRRSDDSDQAIIVASESVNYHNVYNSYAVRPVFYLNSNVIYSSGTGSESDPIRLS